MKDSYLRFANTGFGARLTAMLGLPHPLVLERYQPGQPPTLTLTGGKVTRSGISDVPARCSFAANPTMRPSATTHAVL